jgi:hypothetical protein
MGFERGLSEGEREGGLKLGSEEGGEWRLE